MSESDAENGEPKTEVPEGETFPEWDDDYLNQVAGRLVHNYDLRRDRRVDGETFDLSGEFRVTQQKQVVHPALNYANHDAEEHLFARRVGSPTVAELKRLVELGHRLADEWIEPSETHYSTDFSFVLVADEIPAAVASFVESFSDRTLLKFGYHGHYEVNLAVVAPDAEETVASRNADVARAFVLWEEIEPEKQGLFSRIAHWFWRPAER